MVAESRVDNLRLAASATRSVRIFGYHPELDGLRGVAILGVLATHSFNSIFPGGGVGVDVFFFLSGFLITSLLLNEWSRHGRIDLKKFWMRRALRLLPALVIFVPASVAAAMLSGVSWSDAVSAGAATLFYIANIWRVLGLPSIEPLRHTWSLAIEEQFYLFWPIALWFLLRRGKSPKFIAAVTAILILLLPLWRIVLHYQLGVNARRIRFGPDTRADVLLMGCLLAMMISWHLLPRLLNSKAARYALLPGLGFLGAFVLFGEEGTPHVFVWGYTVIGFACAALVVHAIGTESARFRRALRWRPLAWLGKVSYGFYLWHYLVLYAVRQVLPDVSNVVVVAIAIPLALIVTTASWRLVERPFLRLKGRYSPSGPPTSSSEDIESVGVAEVARPVPAQNPTEANAGTHDPSSIEGRTTMRKMLKIALINVLVLVVLLFTINIASAVALRAYLTYQTRPNADPRARLENYEDQKYAERILREYRDVDVEYAPFVEWNRKPFSGKTTTVDEKGDRVEPNAPPPPAGSPVIRFFGGSTMWGTGADDSGTIPARFRAIDPNWEIHNHGEVGYNTRQDLESLINLLAQGEHMDVVVFYGGMNDILSLCRADVSLNGHESQSKMEDRLAGNERPGLAGFAYGLFLGETAALVQRIAEKGDEQGPGTYACTRDPARAQAVVDTVARELQLARSLVEASGAKFIAVLQPVAEFGHPQTAHIQKDLRTRKHLGEQTKIVYPLYQKAVAASGAGWWYDLSGAFDGDEHIFIDFVHVSANGNAIVSRKIHELVRGAAA